MDKEIKAIFGLGNPGVMYERTRHNVGFMFIDHIISKKLPIEEINKFESIIYKVKFFGRNVLLIKPQTFMNLSGKSYVKVINHFGILPEDTVVVYDDVDLPLGRFRIRERGSHGGHNGMRSIIEMSGTENIPRIRVGINNGEEILDLANFVLSNFSENEFNLMCKVLQKVYEAFKIIFHRGIRFAMSEYNKLTIDGGK